MRSVRSERVRLVGASEWRMEVWRTGWSNSEIRLTARLLEPFQGIYTHVATTHSGPGSITLGIADMQGYVPTWYQYGFDFDRSFPFGFEVFPDTV